MSFEFLSLEKKKTDLNEQAWIFICWNKCTELLYYNCILQDCRLERQLLLEIYVYNTH